MTYAMLIGLVLAGAAACGTPPPKTNAEKCQALGGTYTAATNSCQFQSGGEGGGGTGDGGGAGPELRKPK